MTFDNQLMLKFDPKLGAIHKLNRRSVLNNSKVLRLLLFES